VIGTGPTPETMLGQLRAERAHLEGHQTRVAREWDRTLGVVRAIDFRAVGPGETLEALRGEVEIWNDLALEPPRRITAMGVLPGLSMDDGERYEYLHRVLVGLDPPTFLSMCDIIEGELDLVVAEDKPMDLPELRDRIIELMELSVRCSTRSLEWLEKRIDDAEATG
jgi:hypothetical protein